MSHCVRSYLAAALLAAAACIGLGAPTAAQEPDALRETHGDWEIRCRGGDLCYMYQVQAGEDGEPLIMMRLRKLPEPMAVQEVVYTVEAEIFTRTGFLLPAGIVLQIDDSEASRVPFERCLPNGCGSLPLLTNELIQEFKAGGVVRFTMMYSPEQPLATEISLTGFTAAFNAL